MSFVRVYVYIYVIS